MNEAVDDPSKANSGKLLHTHHQQRQELEQQQKKQLRRLENQQQYELEALQLSEQLETIGKAGAELRGDHDLQAVATSEDVTEGRSDTDGYTVDLGVPTRASDIRTRAKATKKEVETASQTRSMTASAGHNLRSKPTKERNRYGAARPIPRNVAASKQSKGRKLAPEPEPESLKVRPRSTLTTTPKGGSKKTTKRKRKTPRKATSDDSANNHSTHSSSKEAPATEVKQPPHDTPAVAHESGTETVLPRTEYITFEDDFLQAWDAKDDKAETNTSDGYSLLSTSLARIFMTPLKSGEDPSIGAELLIKLTRFHNKIPRKETCQELMDLLVRGPKYKATLFPDCIRMEQAQSYLDVLKTKSPVGNLLADARDWKWWAGVVDTVAQPSSIYCPEGDESRTTSTALLRVGQSLSVKHSGMALLEYIMQFHLEPFLDQEKPRDKTEVECALQETELFKTLFPGQTKKDGTAQALTMVVRATMSIWIHYGHYRSAYFAFPKQELPASATSAPNKVPARASVHERSFVSTEMKNLAETLGKVVSYVAWLYTIEHKKKSISDTAPLIGQVVQQEVNSTKFDPSKFLKLNKLSKEEHWKDMMLQFSLSLDKHCLGKAVAQHLDCNLRMFGVYPVSHELEDDLEDWFNEDVPDDW